MVACVCSVPSKDGPKVYKFKLVAMEGHSVASATVKFMHFGGSRPLMARRTLKSAGEKRARKQAVKSEPGSKGRPRALHWGPHNTAAQLKELDLTRDARIARLFPNSKVLADSCHTCTSKRTRTLHAAVYVTVASGMCDI
jgi:hypothetical protein